MAPDKRFNRCSSEESVTQTKAETKPEQPKPRWRQWLRLGFLIWAVASTAYLANTFRTRDVDPALLASDASVIVLDAEEALQFLPESPREAGLIFLCGSGVAARAYAPLLRPIADAGYAVFIVKLPFRLAPLESHKRTAITRVHRIMEAHSGISSWVVSGHSLGGALACRVARDTPNELSALVLVGTTHPKKDDLAWLRIPVTKVYGTNDGVAPVEKIRANRHLLPEDTKWILIEGANHSQFGHYGHQLFDGEATLPRDEQQRRTRTALLEALEASTAR